MFAVKTFGVKTVMKIYEPQLKLEISETVRYIKLLQTARTLYVRHCELSVFICKCPIIFGSFLGNEITLTLQHSLRTYLCYKK
jgi:hypothetical protein